MNYNEIILQLRGLLAGKEIIDEEIFYHPEHLQIDLDSRLSKEYKPDKDELFINLETDNLKADEIKLKIKNTLDSHLQQMGKLPGKIILGKSAVVTVRKKQTDKTRTLLNKVAIVTGAAGAIGYGICKRLLEEGCFVAITDVVRDKLDQFASEFNKEFSGQFIAVMMDVTDQNSVTNAFDEVKMHWGGFDIVIINAGIALVSSLIEMKLDDFKRLEKVNIDGTLLTISEAAKNFITQGIGGDIVLVSTKNVFSPGANFGAYSATKAASHQLARIASLELAPYGVRVNMVAPDAVFSGGSHKSGLWQEVGPGRMKARGLDEKGLEDYYKNRNLLKTKVTARHVANAVLFFVTHQTPTTGVTIPVDGGLPDATPR
jgi:NAD(P)-dependent dehydrogenase (short-subunit alcohol dehydrogenase family)